MPSLDISLRTFKSSIKNVESVVFVVGAGLSVQSGFDLWPKATDKALKIAEERGMEATALAYARTRRQKNDLYGAFELIESEFNRAAYRNIVLDTFSGRSEANPIQEALLAVPCRGIITTNFDECLAAAAVKVKGEVPIHVIAELLASDRYFIAKPHGSLNHFDSMVLTHSDWKAVLRKGELRDLLSQVVSQNQVILLGYSMGDPDFNQIWDDLLKDRIFRETGLLCCRTGTIGPERIAELFERNIQIVEFDDPDHNFSYLQALLQSLSEPVEHSGTTNTRLDVAVNAHKKVEDLERYVMLCMEFSPSNSSRLQTVCRAILLEKLVDADGPATADVLVKHVSLILSDISTPVKNAATGALTELLTSGLVISVDGALSISDKQRGALREEVEAAAREEIEALNAIVMSLKTSHSITLDIEMLQTLVDRAFACLGSEVAEFFLYNKPATIPSENIDQIVNEYCTQQNIATSLRHFYAEAIKMFLLEPSEKYADVTIRKLQSYFITSAYILDPTSTRLMTDYAKGHSVYLDSSIVLPAMAIGHSSQKLYQSLLSSTSRLGMHLLISKEMLNEVSSNVRTAEAAFSRFLRSNAEMKDILAGYTELQGRGNGNVFLEGYQSELAYDPSLSPANYMRLVMDGSEILTEEMTLRVLRERFGIELDSLQEQELDPDEIKHLTSEIVYLRKTGNRFKSELLCKHEAIQFALLQKRRKEKATESPKVWFVTTDYFFTELQRLEKERYPLPVSYTPRMWLQYLNLLDFDSRGDRNFAKLQQRMRYGVAAGGVGLTAIFLILHEKKELLRKGLTTVKEMAEAIVKEYHVQRSIEDYEFGMKGDDKNTIAKTVRTAVNKLSVVKIKELEQLREQKASAEKRADILERRLAKQKFLKRVNSPNKQKKGGRR
jgi:SIR2-like domain